MNSNRGLYYDLIADPVQTKEEFEERERQAAIAEGLADLYSLPLSDLPTNTQHGRTERKKTRKD